MNPKTALSRRGFLAAAGSAFAGVSVGWVLPHSKPDPVRPSDAAIIRMRSEEGGARVGFHPVGLHVVPETTVRWVLESGAHSTTAYHPDRGRPRRIPAGAAPWDSGILFETGDTFAVRLEVPGVYDVFCVPHEAAGMVGRIVAGVPGVDFEIPSWARPEAPAPKLPDAARAGFPTVDRIVELGRVDGARSDATSGVGE